MYVIRSLSFLYTKDILEQRSALKFKKVYLTFWHCQLQKGSCDTQKSARHIVNAQEVLTIISRIRKLFFKGLGQCSVPKFLPYFHF